MDWRWLGQPTDLPTPAPRPLQYRFRKPWQIQPSHHRLKVGQPGPNGALQLLNPQRIFGGGFGELTIVFLEFANPLEIKSALRLDTWEILSRNFSARGQEL